MFIFRVFLYIISLSLSVRRCDGTITIFIERQSNREVNKKHFLHFEGIVPLSSDLALFLVRSSWNCMFSPLKVMRIFFSAFF